VGYVGKKDIIDVQNYWDDLPCNIRHSQTPLQEDPLVYSHEVSFRKYLVEPHIPFFAEHGLWENKEVLEMGCGIGTDTIQFALSGVKKILGMDISRDSLDIAFQRLQAEKPPDNWTLVQGDIENLRENEHCFFWSDSYDLVYSFGVIHHTPRPWRAIAEAYRMLKPGGEFRLMVYNRYSWKAFWIIMKYGKGRFWKWKELIPKYSEAQTGCPITWTFTPREMKHLLEANGFQVESVTKDHIFPYRIKEYINHQYRMTWYWEMCPPRLFDWLQSKFGWHLLIKARKPKGR